MGPVGAQPTSIGGRKRACTRTNSNSQQQSSKQYCLQRGGAVLYCTELLFIVSRKGLKLSCPVQHCIGLDSKEEGLTHISVAWLLLQGRILA